MSNSLLEAASNPVFLPPVLRQRETNEIPPLSSDMKYILLWFWFFFNHWSLSGIFKLWPLNEPRLTRLPPVSRKGLISVFGSTILNEGLKKMSVSGNVIKFPEILSSMFQWVSASGDERPTLEKVTKWLGLCLYSGVKSSLIEFHAVIPGNVQTKQSMHYLLTCLVEACSF